MPREESSFHGSVKASYVLPKTGTVSVWAGTRKGAFVFRSSNRKTWRMEGPFFRGWEVNHVAQDPREPERHYAAINSAWFGAHIHAGRGYPVGPLAHPGEACHIGAKARHRFRRPAPGTVCRRP
jgi:hypothetical protein